MKREGILLATHNPEIIKQWLYIQMININYIIGNNYNIDILVNNIWEITTEVEKTVLTQFYIISSLLMNFPTLNTSLSMNEWYSLRY